MCGTCGCGQGPKTSVSRILEVGAALLAENETFAAQNRSYFDERSIRCFNLVSSPGAGKTTLLETTLAALRTARVPCAVIISKTDLNLGDFDLTEARRVLTGLNPKAPIFELSARSGVGMPAWLSWLQHASKVHE